MHGEESFSAGVKTEERKRHLHFLSKPVRLTNPKGTTFFAPEWNKDLSLFWSSFHVSSLIVWSLMGSAHRRSAQLSAPSRQSWVRCSTTWTKTRAGKQADPPTNRSTTPQKRRSSGKQPSPRAKTGKQKRLSSPHPPGPRALERCIWECVCGYVCVFSQKGFVNSHALLYLLWDNSYFLSFIYLMLKCNTNLNCPEQVILMCVWK